MDARTVVEMATINGAKAIGLDKQTGSLEVGKQADLIIVDTQTPHLMPHLPSGIPYRLYGKSSDVRDVVVDGCILVKDRNVLSLDVADIMARVRAIARYIKS